MAYSRPRGQRKIPQRRVRALATSGRDPYGSAHRKRRAYLLAQLAAIGSAPCPLCGKPMDISQRLHLHHSNEQAALMGLPGDQLVHGKCNVSAGGKVGAQLTNGKPARPRRWSRTPQREIRTGYQKHIMIADADRCQACKDGAIHYGGDRMSTTCWYGGCEASTPRASGPVGV